MCFQFLLACKRFLQANVAFKQTVAMHICDVFFQITIGSESVGAYFTLEFFVSDVVADVNAETTSCLEYFPAKFTAPFFVAYEEQKSR